jgi:polar amino acid transport system substrate-binding protein
MEVTTMGPTPGIKRVPFLIIILLMTLLPLMPANAQSPMPQVPNPGASPTIDAIRKAGVLRAGVAVAWPWLFEDPQSHKYVGASIDVAEALAKALGVRIQYVPSNWDVIIAGLQSNKFDIIVAPLFATPARMQVVDFVNYTTAGSCYVVLKSNKKISDLDSLNNPEVTVETHTGTGNEQGFLKKYPKAKDYSVPPPIGGGYNIEDVLNGRVDALIINSSDGPWIAEQYPQVRILPKDPQYCVTHPDIPFPIGMAYRKGDTAFGHFAQQVIQAIKARIDADIIKYSNPKYRRGG